VEILARRIRFEAATGEAPLAVCVYLVSIAWETCGSNVHGCGVNHFIRGRNLFFPQLRANIHSTPIVKSQASSWLREHFHQSTTFITTTSLRVLFFLTAFVKALIPAVPVKILICSGPVFLA
jgi:hypothetical protein